MDPDGEGNFQPAKLQGPAGLPWAATSQGTWPPWLHWIRSLL